MSARPKRLTDSRTRIGYYPTRDPAPATRPMPVTTATIAAAGLNDGDSLGALDVERVCAGYLAAEEQAQRAEEQARELAQKLTATQRVAQRYWEAAEAAHTRGRWLTEQLEAKFRRFVATTMGGAW